MDLEPLVRLEFLAGLVGLYCLVVLAVQEHLGTLETQLDLAGQEDIRNPYSNIPQFVLAPRAETRTSLC